MLENETDFPATADQLHDWLRSTLDLSIPRTPITPGHAAPFAYIEHAFFEAGHLLDPPHPTPAGPALDAVVWANRGGGKTFLGALATMLDLVFKPGIEIRILGGSLEQSKRMLAHLRRFFQHEALEPMLDGRITEHRVRLRNGSIAEVLAQSQTSVRGTRVQKLRCDEVELFDPEVWEAAQLTTRSAHLHLAGGRAAEVRGSIECLSTMHRPYGLMQTVVEEAREGARTLFRWGLVDVLEHCGPEHQCEGCTLHPECSGRAKRRVAPGHIRIHDAVRMKARVSQASWESEMLSLRPRRSDAVYPEFDPAVHIVGAGPEWRAPEGTLVAGMDFGFRAPTVVLWAILDRAEALWVVAERVKSETRLADHARALSEGPGVDGLTGPPAWVGVDPAGMGSNGQTGVTDIGVLRGAGLLVQHRARPIHVGVELVRARLRPAASDPRLFVHARCARLIECLQRYHYPPDHPESLQPVKDGFDHAPDALRYLVQNLDCRFEAKCRRYL
ncbi:MAG: hypothetical protein IPJ41_18545 [Phycisphaerales bacterium]|nr:hypothetical protein [Phycisphaerales bacterium]